ncbi:MAG: twin-arginine translocation signal domain-containing protein [Patescibacteria group bacterium]|nr:twin-arginine translocation signal domain-containing protein [Patescibacteria group bacterium]
MSLEKLGGNRSSRRDFLKLAGVAAIWVGLDITCRVEATSQGYNLVERGNGPNGPLRGIISMTPEESYASNLRDGGNLAINPDIATFGTVEGMSGQGISGVFEGSPIPGGGLRFFPLNGEGFGMEPINVSVPQDFSIVEPPILYGDSVLVYGTRGLYSGVYDLTSQFRGNSTEDPGQIISLSEPGNQRSVQFVSHVPDSFNGPGMLIIGSSQYDAERYGHIFSLEMYQGINGQFIRSLLLQEPLIGMPLGVFGTDNPDIVHFVRSTSQFNRMVNQVFAVNLRDISLQLVGTIPDNVIISSNNRGSVVTTGETMTAYTRGLKVQFQTPGNVNGAWFGNGKVIAYSTHAPAEVVLPPPPDPVELEKIFLPLIRV